MLYKFPTRRVKTPSTEFETLEFYTQPEEREDAVHIIQGKVADSAEEWRVSVALDSIHRNYVYQYLIGLAGIAGSYEVDFLVEDAPQWFPLEVQSERWHTGQYAVQADIRASKIEAYFQTEIRYVFEDELQTQEDANMAIKEVLYNYVYRRRIRV